MRILHTESSQGWGGQEIRILTEAAGMIARGHRVNLLCPATAPIYERAARHGVPATALPMARKSLVGVLAVRGWLLEHTPDVIVTHSSIDTWLVALACLTLRRPPPLVRLRHVSVPVSRGLSSRWLYHRASCHVITTGEFIRQQLIHDNGLPPQRVTSIPTGIDLTRFSPGDPRQARQQLGLPESGPVLGIVGTLRSWKGHDDLLQALILLHRPDTRLLIVGDGPRRQVLTDAVASLGLSAQVTLVGDQTDVVPWLRAMDLFVLPSTSNEGVPQAVMQAMACGLPVLATTAGAIPEVVRPNATGLLVPPRNPPALAQALATLLDAPEARARLGAGGLALARQECSLPRMLERMEELLTRVVQGHYDTPN